MDACRQLKRDDKATTKEATIALVDSFLLNEQLCM